jgi:hypothetical protein
VHCFENTATFAQNIGIELREQCREYLNHVLIGYPRYTYQQAPYSRPDPLWWKSILLCKNLRSLEVEPEQLRDSFFQYLRLPANLPHLKTLTLAHIRKFPCHSYHMGRGARVTIWVKVTQNIPLGLDELELTEAIRDFLTNRLVHVNFEVNKEFLWQTPTDPAVLAHHLKDNNSIQTVTLRDRTVLDLPIYGLPNSGATRVSHYRKRAFEQNRLKAANIHSLEQTKLALFVKETKEKKKKQQTVEERATLHLTQRIKKINQDEFRQEQAVAESKNRANQRTHKQRKIRQAEQIKHEERKRVPKKHSR